MEGEADEWLGRMISDKQRQNRTISCREPRSRSNYHNIIPVLTDALWRGRSFRSLGRAENEVISISMLLTFLQYSYFARGSRKGQ